MPQALCPALRAYLASSSGNGVRIGLQLVVAKSHGKMAIPAGSRVRRNLNEIGEGLGRKPPFEIQRLSERPPKPEGPPEKENPRDAGTAQGIGSDNQNSKPNIATDDPIARAKRAKHQEIDRRYAWDAKQKRRQRRPNVKEHVRLRELERLLDDRYRGECLPDDDAGRDDLEVVAQHIAHIYGNPDDHVAAWAAAWAPWLTAIELRNLIHKVTTYPRKWKADTLAWEMGLKMDDRTRLRITTIGAIDSSKEHREQARREAAKEREQARRRKAGAAPRQQYEGASDARAKPWETLGMSRSSWYAKGKPMPAFAQTGPSTAESQQHPDVSKSSKSDLDRSVRSRCNSMLDTHLSKDASRDGAGERGTGPCEPDAATDRPARVQRAAFDKVEHRKQLRDFICEHLCKPPSDHQPCTDHRTCPRLQAIQSADRSAAYSPRPATKASSS